MPAWWGKKSSKNKETKTFNDDVVAVSNHKKKTSSSDGELIPSNKNSPRGSRDYFSSSSATGGSSSICLSSSATGGSSSIGFPLPSPSGSGTDQLNELSCGSGSTSESSVSSCGSSAEDHSINTIRSSRAPRGDGDLRFNTSRSPRRESRSPVPGSRSPCPGYRSPGPASTRPSRSASPIHPLLGCTNPESPTGKIEDAKNECHPLPLPPSSPCSSSSLPNRTAARFENTSGPVTRWKKGKLLGRGTFGHVYLGFNSEGGQMCAIKEVKVVSDDQTSKECLKQLNQEINLLKQLQHPNIVRYYGSELSDETLSVYLEYVSGGSIHKLLQEYGAFKEPVIQNYTRQIVFGLAYLHGKDTVHRDIKGANILVDPNGEIKLADFGMAKHITSCSSMLSFKGSPYWMAPEVVMNTNGYNLAVDIWSLGCTILEMATSKPPWSRYEGVAAIFKIGNSKDMPDIPDHLSNDAKKFIKLCLQRDPSARPSASQLLDHPFIRDPSTTKSFNMNITRDAFPFNSDGTCTPPVLDLRPNRTNAPSTNGDYAISPVITSVCGLRNTRDSIRNVTSLPVSPSTSPLRQSGRAHKSGLLSPPYQTYPLVGQSGYNMSDYSFFKRPSTLYNHELGMESSFLQGQCHGTSPRTRLI